MDEKTLSTILGHYSVAFTMDTYAHVLTDHLNQEMGLMEELYHINMTTPQNLIYPVIVTATGRGYLFQCPDFPEIQLDTPTVEAGAAAVTAALRDAVVAIQFPPPPAIQPESSSHQGSFYFRSLSDCANLIKLHRCF